MAQQTVVALLVLVAAGYTVWTLSGAGLQRQALRVLLKALPALRTPLAPLQRRLEAPAGCGACRPQRR